jgi:hypothetical protein|tara:strand:- start:264 stop:458 length:195 start_codon:yes stop_codon:yes gene_type:complete
MTLTDTNARAVISKLKHFNFPILRGSVQPFEIECIEKELDEIEKSIVHFRSYLKATKDSINIDE